MVVSSIELCAGVGMLGEGVRAGFEHLGLSHRAVCYVEREAHAASDLVARMEEGSLDAAPVWSDMLTFDGRAWRGKVDCVIAGFPCQDLSVAGKREGLDAPRSGLFFRVLDIADDCDAQWLVLENVAGITSAVASVVDEESASEYVGHYRQKGFSQVGVEDGRLLERAAARVVGELADRGWHAEWLHLSASDVGASHGRPRWFCFAWRLDMDEPKRRGREGADVHLRQPRQDEAALGAGGASDGPLADAARHVGHGQGWEARSGRGIRQASDGMGNPNGQREQRAWREDGPDTRQWTRASLGGPGGPVVYTQSIGRRQGRPEHGREQGRHPTAGDGGAVAHTGRQGLPQRVSGGGLRDAAPERTTGPDIELHGYPFFAPGPADTRWAGIIERWPHLNPALEPSFCSVVNGLAFDMDDSRAARLKCVGNGVVAAAAGVAVVVLLRRAGVVMNRKPQNSNLEPA